MLHARAIRPQGARAQPALAMSHRPPTLKKENAMLIRNTLIALALAGVAGSAFAAAPQASTAAGAQKSSAAAKSEHKEKRTCEQRGKTGHCEKWAKETKSTDAKASAPAKTP
jgi:hypothetical protein